MAYLIDGNNVMGQLVGWHRDKAGARRSLLDQLAAFANSRRAKVEVVFDGAPEEFFPDGSSYRGVSVFYAERGSNADERIKRIVDTHRERRTLKVVTSDRELATYVRRCGVNVVRSGEFRRQLDEIDSKNLPAQEDTPDTKTDDLPTWMRYFGVGPEDDFD